MINRPGPPKDPKIKLNMAAIVRFVASVKISIPLMFFDQYIKSKIFLNNVKVTFLKKFTILIKSKRSYKQLKLLDVINLGEKETLIKLIG